MPRTPAASLGTVHSSSAPLSTRAAPFFVMAHHRSGSNFLNDLLQSHPQVECINEPLSMHTHFFREHDLNCWSEGDFDDDILHPSLAAQEPLREYLHEFRHYLGRSDPGRVIGFKDTVLFGKLDWLRRFLPSLKIVFLKREPNAIVSSVLRSNLMAFWDYAHLVPPAFKAVHPTFRSSARSDDEASAEVVAMSVVVRYEMAQRAIGAFEHLSIQLEDIMREPASAVEDIADFLGIARHDGPLHFIEERRAESRGGRYSSFRTRDDVEHAWERHLSVGQRRVIANVVACMRTSSPVEPPMSVLES